MEEERVAVLEGKDAKDFLEYVSRDATEEEKESLKRAHEFYKRHCKF
ncbi:MAG TPA: hypothetical protein VF172_03490 [Nitrososphaera sp.]|jgi:hypothetical protein|nr:hypothetical protein [Nitrososphaera sp.]